MVDHKHYTYRVTCSEGDGEYVAPCAEFPSLGYMAAEQGVSINRLVSVKLA
jgi:hypothetical protein